MMKKEGVLQTTGYCAKFPLDEYATGVICGQFIPEFKMKQLEIYQLQVHFTNGK